MKHYLAIHFAATTLLSKSPIFNTELSGTEMSPNRSENDGPIIKLEVDFIYDN